MTNRINDMTTGSPVRRMLRFAVPVFLGNLFNLAYNLADTRIIGSMLGSEALASVGAVSTLYDLLVGLLVGLANGFAVMTAQYFGMKKQSLVRRSFLQSMYLGGAIALGLTLLCSLFLQPVFGWLHVAPAQYASSYAYMRIVIPGLLFCLLYNVQAANLRAIGDAVTPLIFLIVSTVLNVALDILFIGPFGMGVAGAALATIMAQAVSAVLCWIYAWIRFPNLHPRQEDLKPDFHLMKTLLPGGISMGLMSSLVAFGTLSLQTAINTLGTNIIVAHTGTRKLTNIFMLPFSVFGSTMATFCGQNYGAGRMDRVKQGLVRALQITWTWSVLCMIASYTICPILVRSVTGIATPEVVDTACRYQRIDTLFYMVPSAITILRNGLQGLGEHRVPVVSSGLELLGKIVFAYLFTPCFGYEAIIWSEPVVWIIMVIPLVMSMRRKLGDVGRVS